MEVQIEFKGRKAERTLAEEIYNLMAQQGAMYAMDTPIRQSLENLAEHFHQRGLRRDRNRVVELIEIALEKNDHIFAREAKKDEVFYITTKRGCPVDAEEEPSLPPRQLHKPPEGATAKPRRKAVRRPPMAPFWVRAAIRQMQPPRPTPTPRPATATIPTVEKVAVAAVAREQVLVTELALQEGTVIDFAKQSTEIFALHGEEIGRRLKQTLGQDFRVFSFGDQWYLEEQLEHFSKGRLNEIRRYVLEEETPLTDETILGDLFFMNPRDSNYTLWAFSLNSRLLREKKEFEYVGVPGSNLWSVKGLPSIGATWLKASDIGQDYAFLLDEEDELEEVPTQLEHFLTFYEYRHGVLPYNARFRSFFPPAVLEDQRSAQLRFEVPQHYEAYTVEIRYPSGNRGGWLWGLEDFFHSSLVPGAFIIISRTDDPDIFVLQYMATDAQERSLLVYDDRRSRYVFDDILFYCETEEGLVLSEDRYPNLRNSKALSPSKRKRPADVVAHAFTLVGEKQDGQYLALVNDLYPVVNIERPFSMAFLEETLAEIDVFSQTDEKGFYLYDAE